MHEQAYNFVRDNRNYVTYKHMAWTGPYSVLDLGGRDINGSVRDLFDFPVATYDVVDIQPGDNVDIVADAATYQPERQYDAVVCCETFEHTDSWPAICETAYKALRPGGQFITTMAGPGRPEHSAIDGEFRLHPGEYYGNVDPAELFDVLERCGFENVYVDSQPSPADVRATANRPLEQVTA
jgi:SAM-dependent methyltransferase